MIIDKAGRLPDYAALLPHLQAGLDAVAALGAHPAVGRYEFEGGYLMIQRGTTSPAAQGDFEAHRRYIDVQIMLEGSEEVIWEETAALAESLPYDAERERALYHGEVKHVFTIEAGMAWVAFASDAHKACKHTGTTPRNYLKVVMKLPLG
mgnify:CR=1 FL=1